MNEKTNGQSETFKGKIGVGMSFYANQLMLLNKLREESKDFIIIDPKVDYAALMRKRVDKNV
ncbi:MAG: hypothetical protein N2645_17720 [Clostridia bacterium]|nr:hypothetical protein [Clostridia bacterium]